MIMRIRIFSFLILSTLLFSCGSDKNTSSLSTKKEDYFFELKGEAQGTTFTVKYISRDSVDLSTEIAQILRDIDMELSLWLDSSTITTINAIRSEDRPMQSRKGHFEEVLRVSQSVYYYTKGDFNPAVMPLVRYWGFARQSEAPEKVDEKQIQAYLAHMNFEPVAFENGVLKTGDSEMQLDFNAVAQGYSVDVVARMLKDRGISDFMVEIGGEVSAKGKNREGKVWTIGIEQPSDINPEHKLIATVELNDRSLATSGNYRKFYEKNGVKYSHTIDPKTGYPVQHTLLSATVVTYDAALADAVATAFMVMGTDKAKEFITDYPQLYLDAYLIYSGENGEYLTWMSEGLKSSIKEMKD